MTSLTPAISCSSTPSDFVFEAPAGPLASNNCYFSDDDDEQTAEAPNEDTSFMDLDTDHELAWQVRTRALEKSGETQSGPTTTASHFDPVGVLPGTRVRRRFSSERDSTGREVVIPFDPVAGEVDAASLLAKFKERTSSQAASAPVSTSPQDAEPDQNTTAHSVASGFNPPTLKRV